jgi:DNA-binding response OmpR family regulator
MSTSDGREAANFGGLRQVPVIAGRIPKRPLPERAILMIYPKKVWSVVALIPAFVEHHDATIVDVQLPDGDGIELCRRLRKQDISSPILILSVLTTTADKVRGLDAGADDYLTKPFQTDELLARLRSLLRRSQAIEGGILQSGDLQLNLIERKVYVDDVPVRMSNKEIALLEYLMRNPRKLLSRTMISESV